MDALRRPQEQSAGSAGTNAVDPATGLVLPLQRDHDVADHLPADPTDDANTAEIERILDAHAYDLARDDHVLRSFHNIPKKKAGTGGRDIGGADVDDILGEEALERMHANEREEMLNAVNMLGPHHDTEDGLAEVGERVVDRYMLEPKVVEERLVSETLQREEREVTRTNVKLVTVTETQKDKIVGLKPYRVYEKIYETPQVVVKEKIKINRGGAGGPGGTSFRPGGAGGGLAPVAIGPEDKIVERVIEKPVIEVVEKIVEVPVVKHVTKEVPGPVTVVYEEKRVEVPKIIYEDRFIEIPRVIYEEKVFYEDRLEYREVIVDRVVEETVVKNRAKKKRVEQLVPVYLIDDAELDEDGSPRKRSLSDTRDVYDPENVAKQNAEEAARQAAMAGFGDDMTEQERQGALMAGVAVGRGAKLVEGIGGRMQVEREVRTTETQEVSRLLEAHRVEYIDVPVVTRVSVPTYRVVYPDGRKRLVQRVPGYPTLPIPPGYATNVLRIGPGGGAGGSPAKDTRGATARSATVRYANLGNNPEIVNTVPGPPSVDLACNSCGRTGSVVDTLLSQAQQRIAATGGQPNVLPNGVDASLYQPSFLEGVSGGPSGGGGPGRGGRPGVPPVAPIPTFFPGNYYRDSVPPDPHAKLNYNSIHPNVRASDRQGGGPKMNVAGGGRGDLGNMQFYPEREEEESGGEQYAGGDFSVERPDAGVSTLEEPSWTNSLWGAIFA